MDGEWSEKTLPRHMEPRFYEPYWRDSADEEGSILFYEFGEIEWQVEFDQADSLRCLIVVSPPLMNDEEQRRAHGVNEPRPPN